MSDFVVDGQPWQPPESTLEQGYALTPPSSQESSAALTGETSTLGPFSRALGAGQYEDGWWGHLARGISAAAAAEQGATLGDVGLTPDLKPIPAPKLTADDANKKYAPLGPDGKPVPITDQDVPEPVAKMLGKAKADELDREAVLAGYQEHTSWPMRFASGTAAFMMDPLNAASVFLPGVGEETALAGAARLGMTGIAGRTAARLAAGAATGAIAQAPLSVARYGLASYAGQDYSLRDAFRDMMYGAAGGAILHAGFGALGDTFTKRPDVAPVLNADAATRADAMRAAVSQIIDGREVELEPVFQQARSLVGGLESVAPQTFPIVNEGQIRGIAEAQSLRTRATEIGNELSELPQGDAIAAEKLSHLEAVERDLANATGPERRALSNRRDELLADTTPEALRAAAAPLEQRRTLEAERASIADRLVDLEKENAPPLLGAGPINIGQRSIIPYSLAELAERQRQIYRDGFAPGVSQSDFDAARKAIYGEPKSAAETENVGAGKAAQEAQPAPKAEGAVPAEGETPARVAGEEGAEGKLVLPLPATPELDKQLAEAQATIPAELHPEDQAEIVAADQAMNEAQSAHDAYAQAAQCLKDAYGG